MSHGGGGGCCPAMDLMRSEEMQLVQVIIPAESAHLAVSYLGDLGLLQFKDVSAFRFDFDPFAPLRSVRSGWGIVRVAAWCSSFLP